MPSPQGVGHNSSGYVPWRHDALEDAPPVCSCPCFVQQSCNIYNSTCLVGGAGKRVGGWRTGPLLLSPCVVSSGVASERSWFVGDSRRVYFAGTQAHGEGNPHC